MFNALNGLIGSSSTLTWFKVLTGISKSLGIVRQVLPLYNEFKPLIKKIPITLSKVTLPKYDDTYAEIKDEIKPILTKIDGPVFFQ